jgi:iron complex outermembrane receptor protein
VELELNYSPLENLQILGGLAYTDAVIDATFNAAAAPLVGAQLTNSAKRSANLWTRYDVSEGALRGLGIGVGVFYSSEIAGSLPSTGDGRVLLLPSYTVADLAFYYNLQDRYAFTLKVGNVFDKLYFEGVNSTTNENGVVPGTPRNVTLSLRVSLW